MRRCMWCRNLKNEEAMARVGPQRHRGKKSLIITNYVHDHLKQIWWLRCFWIDPTYSNSVELRYPPRKDNTAPLALSTLKSVKCHNYLLTYSMVQSPSSEANWFAASQEIPRISWNPKVHYRTHKRPPPVSILGQPNPVHIPTSHLLEIHPNIIHPSTSSSRLRFPHQDPIYFPFLTHTCQKCHNYYIYIFVIFSPSLTYVMCWPSRAGKAFDLEV